jgi:hypothetical protein
MKKWRLPILIVGVFIWWLYADIVFLYLGGR